MSTPRIDQHKTLLSLDRILRSNDALLKFLVKQSWHRHIEVMIQCLVYVASIVSIQPTSVLHQLDQKIIYPHYDFKHLTEKYFEIGMKLDDFLIQLVKYCTWLRNNKFKKHPSVFFVNPYYYTTILHFCLFLSLFYAVFINLIL